MLERARTWLKSHLPDPERTGLRAWLIAIQVAIVLLVGGGIAWYASGMLHELADQQGKARVQLAATTAREDLRRIGEDALATARALADRPTLQRLLAEGQSEALPPFLGTGARRATWTRARCSRTRPWWRSQDRRSTGSRSLPRAPSRARRSSRCRPPSACRCSGRAPPCRIPPSRSTWCGAWMSALARALSAEVGAEVRLIDYRNYTGTPVNAFTALYSAALADGRSAVQRIDAQEVYAASVPVFASSGEAVALIAALLPVSAVDAPARHLVKKLLIAALRARGARGARRGAPG